PNSFEASLPPGQSDLAKEVFKDPYLFEFISLPSESLERDVEEGLLDHLKDFILELGVGFAFVGSQVPLNVEGDSFYLDLLFFHTRLRCYVVLELKRGKFLPDHVGKLQFYLAAVDTQIRHPEDRPSIGIVLCQSRNRTVVEYTLRDTGKPIGVSEYRTLERLPEGLEKDLPTSQQLKLHLGENKKIYGVAEGSPGLSPRIDKLSTAEKKGANRL
ncbi:MAG: DUF1016 domain-containing protein, partial [Candidatus Omnitrophica bacterium]|nr:DUF1016 domain-containing protein [Candidatus Omnitrophota bacterium]